MIAPILARREAAGFWLAVVLTGVGTGLAAAALTGLLELVQHTTWSGGGVDLLEAASKAAPWWHLAVLFAAGLLTAFGQLLLSRLSSGSGVDITAAIWFHAGRLPAGKTLASAVLSIVLVGMGSSLGREGAPKQAGAVIGNALSDRAGLSDDARRLLVACGAGSGMAAAYGVPLRGALFALSSSPAPVVAVQALDGLSGAVIGVLLPLVVADISREGGRFNLSMGAMGLANAGAAALSTEAAGLVADRYGTPGAFVALSAAGIVAFLLLWLLLPETRSPRMPLTT